MSRFDTIVVSRMISILVLSVFAGCSDDPAMPLGEHRLQVSAVAPGGSQLVTGAASDFSIRLDEVLLVLGEVKLETAGVDGTVDFVDQRSVVLPLSLVDGEPVLAFDLDAPAGTYKELEISVDKLEIGHPTENALIEVYPDLANASILVSGTVIRNGAEEPFVAAYDADIDLELDLTPHLIVTTQNQHVTLLTVMVDVPGWFRSGAGILLDPANPTNRSTIMSNIQQSIETALSR